MQTEKGMENNMKKLLMILLVFVMCASTFVVTAVEPTFVAKLETSIDGNDQIKLVVKNAPLNAYIGFAIFDANGFPVYLENQRAKQSEETAIYYVKPSHALSGELTATASISGSDIKLTQSLYYYSYAEQQAAIDYIMNGDHLTPPADVTDPVKITERLWAKQEQLSLEMESGLYIQLVDKNSFATRLHTALMAETETVEAGRFNELFFESALLELLNKGSLSDISVILADVIAMDQTGFSAMTEEYGWYNALTNKTAVLSLVKGPFTTISQFNDALQEQCFIAKLNTLHVSEMLDLFKHADENYLSGTFDLDFESYDGLNDTRKSYFLTQLDATYTSLNDVKRIFDAALESASVYEERNENPDSERPSSNRGGSVGSIAAIVDGGMIDNGAANNKGFNDLSSVSWAKEAIEAFAERGIVSGMGNNQFMPNNSVTREQFVKMLLGTFEIKTAAGNGAFFHDVHAGQWYYEYVQTAVSLGLASGYGDTFGIGDSITREDMAVMIYNCAKRQGIELVAKHAESPADYDSVSGYAKEAVDVLYKAGIINGVGDGSYAPKMQATRAQAVKLLYELWRVVG